MGLRSTSPRFIRPAQRDATLADRATFGSATDAASVTPTFCLERIPSRRDRRIGSIEDFLTALSGGSSKLGSTLLAGAQGRGEGGRQTKRNRSPSDLLHRRSSLMRLQIDSSLMRLQIDSSLMRLQIDSSGRQVPVPGGPGRLPAQGSHRPVRARIRAYGSSNHGFAAWAYTEWTTRTAGSGYRSRRRLNVAQSSERSRLRRFSHFRQHRTTAVRNCVNAYALPVIP